MNVVTRVANQVVEPKRLDTKRFAEQHRVPAPSCRLSGYSDDEDPQHVNATNLPGTPGSVGDGPTDKGRVESDFRIDRLNWREPRPTPICLLYSIIGACAPDCGGSRTFEYRATLSGSGIVRFPEPRPGTTLESANFVGRTSGPRLVPDVSHQICCDTAVFILARLRDSLGVVQARRNSFAPREEEWSKLLNLLESVRPDRRRY